MENSYDTKGKIKKRCEVHSNKVFWAIEALERDMTNFINHGKVDLMEEALKEIHLFIKKHDSYKQILLRCQKDLESAIESSSHRLDI